MNQKRIFTEEELNRLGRRTLDLIMENLEAGDIKTASGLTRRMFAEFLGMHDLYRNWVSYLLSFIGENYGDEVLSDALRYSVNGYTSKFAKAYDGVDIKTRVMTLCAGLRGHLHEFKVEENDEEITLTPTEVCGSGGRLVREGAYEGPDALLKISKAQDMTFGQTDFPVYCTHCYFQNSAPAGKDGEPIYITEAAKNVGKEPCKVIIRKKN
jgi:hypothetical protein